LEWSESEYAEGKTPREPSGVGQIPQNLRNGFPSELHRAVGHQDMDRRIGVPDIEFWIEQSERLRIVTNRSYDDARLSRFVLRRLLDPTPDPAADRAFVVE
jgi:hypothetical protein